MKTTAREQAMELRQKGWSYNVIHDRLNISKSTLSHWLRDVPFTPNSTVLKRIQTGPARAGILNHQKRIDTTKETKKVALQEVGDISKRDLFMIGIGLYIGEGSKQYEDIRITNSDPRVIQLAMRWFRTICEVPEKNFFAVIHVYPDTSERTALTFWSKLTGIPFSQFGKAQIDLRPNKSQKKPRLLPYGTISIRVRACSSPKFGVLLHRRIIGWIEAVYNAGVV
jgi:hypothetical protein